MALKTNLNYSPNFYSVKRNPKQIKFLIFHYTGMKNESEAIKKLTNIKSHVSCHYFIKNNGDIILMVPDLYIAWHAGKSSWKKFKSLNKYSIGIEINNPGHQFEYKKYSAKQINSILSLSKFLIKKYRIKKENILGHSDISPDRKKDPGEKFPWKYLSKKKISYWHDLDEKKLLSERNKRISKLDKKTFIQNLIKIGYSKHLCKKNSKLLIKNFQRRFRQKLINGLIDKECLLISKKLLRKLK
tara:strand:- start:87 stop:815 length:729 start_codon:yes stop_codon:yes gene_type:complete